MSERPVSDRHLGVEHIAAYLDGRLAHADREWATSHLARCGECYELFAETARFLREEERQTAGDAGGAALPLASPEPAKPADGRVLRPAGNRWTRTGWIGIAAAAAVAAVLVWTPAGDFLRSTDAPSLAGLAASLPPAEHLSPVVAASWEHRGWPVMRGVGPGMDAEHERAFQLGVRVVELEIALSAGDGELARSLTYDLDRLTTGEDGTEPLRSLYADGSGIRGRLMAGEPPQSLVDVNRAGDGLLGPNADTGHPGFVDGFWYAFGKWAAAAHAAAAARDAGFFTGRARRRELRDFADHEVPSTVAPALTRLVELIENEPEHHLPQIEHELQRLIAAAGGGTEEVR